MNNLPPLRPANPNKSMIREHIRGLLYHNNAAALNRFAGLVTNAVGNAAENWMKRRANRRPSVGFFAKLGNIAGGRSGFSISVRWNGLELGILELVPREAEPIFKLHKPQRENSKLTAVFARIKELGQIDWPALHSGCAWASTTARNLFLLLAKCQPPNRLSELAIEEGLVAKLRNANFWFPRCALVQWTNGQAFPFKFPSPIVVKQRKHQELDDHGECQTVIGATSLYGYPDIMARCEGAIGGRAQRLGVFELKRPGGYAHVSLLQACSYAIAYDEVLKGGHACVPHLRSLFGYPRQFPANIRFAAYAVVEEEDVVKVLNSNLTRMVLRDTADELVLGILGYKLQNDVAKLASAVHWREDRWTSFIDYAKRDRIKVSLAP